MYVDCFLKRITENLNSHMLNFISMTRSYYVLFRNFYSSLFNSAKCIAITIFVFVNSGIESQIRY